jgi:uncharacterized small protein (DUF1192 family)
MSIIDRMTDEDLRLLVQYKDEEIERLQALVKYFRDDRDRLYKFSTVKSKRIISLTEEINSLKQELEAKSGVE